MQQLGEFSLIRTRLAPPRTGSAPLVRETLLAMLAQRGARTLTLVVSPAGAGKTMLLTQWRAALKEQDFDVAWFNAGPDDDELQIAAYLVAGLHQAGVAINTDALKMFTRSGGKVWKPLLASLVNDTLEHTGNIYFFIDDFHFISAFGILQLIDRWIEAAPPNLHFVIGSRVSPPLNLSTLQAADQVTELDFRSLKFDDEETRRFIEARGFDPEVSRHATTMQTMTDGWAAGLQLLAFSLRNQGNPEQYLSGQAALSLSKESTLVDYLDQVVAEHLGDDELRFLVSISICRRFNRSLCELLTGDPNARKHLLKFETENLFLLRIDTQDDEPWYRFHRLFSEYLQRRLQHYGNVDIRRLHQLASHWFADRALPFEALRHARQADDADFMVELIDQSARAMINGANFVELLDWCADVPMHALVSRVNIALCLGWAQISCGRINEFNVTLSEFERSEQVLDPAVRYELQLLRAFRDFQRDDTNAQLHILEPMLRENPPFNAFQHLLLHNLVGMGLVYANRFDEARDIVYWQHRHRNESSVNPHPFLDMIQGMSHLTQGHFREAIQQTLPIFRQVQDTSTMGADPLGSLMGYLVEAYYQFDDLDASRELLDQYEDIVETVAWNDSLLYCYRVRARLECLDNDLAGAQRSLEKLEDIGVRKRLDRLVGWSLYDQLTLALQLGNSASADELLRRLDNLRLDYTQSANSALGDVELAAMLGRAELAFARDLPDRLALLEEAQAASDARGRSYLSIRCGLLIATTLLLQDERGAALARAEVMLDKAWRLGMRRLIPEIGRHIQPLLEAVTTLNLLPEVSEWLERSLVQAVLVETPMEQPDENQLLTARESDVLYQLSQGLSNKGIARTLELSAGTVKWHLKNIYGKLGAFSRDDALVKARAASLIK